VETAAATVPDNTVVVLAEGVRAGDRALLARAISLVESTSSAHEARARELILRMLPFAGRSTRVAITGVPGAGKSTFIERLGLHLVERGHKVAVLAIDPSSGVTGGSILGDRTRMGRLSMSDRAFIRPSSSRGSLGGVTPRTREAIALCEAAGYDVVLLETVGVGQSETMAHEMSDCFVVLALAGAGDELQGIKRGLMELVDVIAVNKADGPDVARASAAAQELALAAHVSRESAGSRGVGSDGAGSDGAGSDGARNTPPDVTTCSAATGANIEHVWGLISARVDAARRTGAFDARRRAQACRWLRSLVDERAARALADSFAARSALARAQDAISRGVVLAPAAADEVVGAFLDGLRFGAPVALAHAEHTHGAHTMTTSIQPQTTQSASTHTATDHAPASLPSSLIAARAVNHIGIAVRSLAAARPFYEGTLGARYEGEEDVPEQRVRVAFYALGDGPDGTVRLEILEPTSPDSPIAQFIEKRGEGLHHVAYTVHDIAARLAALKAGGVRMIDESPRIGAHGTKIAFVHPKSSLGVLTELCEPGPHVNTAHANPHAHGSIT
jgi:LAO/AO transport system kinase